MRRSKTTMAIAFTLALMLVAVGQAGFLAGTQPDNLGVHGSRLAAPALTPNSVSSQSRLYPDNPQSQAAYIEPLAFKGEPGAAMARLAAVLVQTGGTVLVEQQENYLYAQSSTSVLKFTDDVEFWLDPAAGVIHMRSASRLGHSDFGSNRKRLEDIRLRFGN
jgi:uncharacterized protein (DUF1499 family)